MFELLFTLVILGFVAFLVDTHVPMSAPIKTVFRALVVLVLCMWLLSAFGIVDLPARLR